MAFGQTRDEKIRKLEKLPEPKKEEKPVAIPVGNIGVVNLEQQKKPHNINIRNFNPNEPKVKANMKYSGKQNYRRYKTKIEPNLISKILVNDENNIVNKIKEAFGIQPDSQNSNFSEVETSSVPFYKGVDETIREPERPARGRPEFIDDLINEIIDISLEDTEELTFQSIDKNQEQRNEAARILQYNIGKRLSRKANKSLARDLDDALTVSKLDDKKDLTVSKVVRGNKVIGLNWSIDNSPKRQERYSLGLDRALPTPKKFVFQPATKDASTSPRGAGRPSFSTYRSANPVRTSIGEMTNPSAF